MNAVIEKQKAKSLPKKAAPAPEKNDLGASLSLLQGLLDSAWKSGNPEQSCCDGARLLATLLNAMEQSLRHGDQPVRDHLRNATSRAQLVLAFEMCQEIADELGVRHIDTIGKNFYEVPNITA